MRTCLLILLLVVPLFGQGGMVQRAAAFSAGIGSINGETVPVGSLNLSVQLDLNLLPANDVYIRLQGMFAKDVNWFLPENREGRNYPYMIGASLQAVWDLPLSESLMLESGAGPLYLQDNTYKGETSNAFGLMISEGITFYLNSAFPYLHGLTIGIGTEYGFTFNGTNPQIYSVFGKVGYRF